MKPVLSEWMTRARASIEREPRPCFLVAHSLGCTTVAHLTVSDPKLPVRGAFLVAPPDLERPDTPSEIRNFGPTPTPAFSFPAMIIASSNDPMSDLGRSQHLARCWRGAFIDVGPKGHIGENAGLGEWEEGLRLLADLLASSSPSAPISAKHADAR
jgi:predicted alpha/beta hydrolase family esterase